MNLTRHWNLDPISAAPGPVEMDAWWDFCARHDSPLPWRDGTVWVWLHAVIRRLTVRP